MSYKQLFNEFLNGCAEFPNISDLNKWLYQRDELNKLMNILDVLKKLKITNVDNEAIVLSGVFIGDEMRIIKGWRNA